MSAISEAAADLRSALEAAGVEGGWGVSMDPAQPGPRPAVVIGPPSLHWESVVSAPTGARFLVYVIVDADQFAIEKLWELVPAVAEVIDTVTDAAVREANPAAFVVGTTELPCYETLVEVSLQ